MRTVILLFMLGMLSLAAQPRSKIPKVGIDVSGVELTYNKVNKTMTLIIKPNVMQTNDIDMYTLVKISKSAELRIVINGQTISSSETFFAVEGHIVGSFWFFSTHKPPYCDDVFTPSTRINKFTFRNIQRGDEYILSVSNLCNGKYETNYKSASLITN